jgi:hypothetical protein
LLELLHPWGQHCKEAKTQLKTAKNNRGIFGVQLTDTQAINSSRFDRVRTQ